MDLQLQGKRALITGSSSGIGAAVARQLAAEGVKVVIHGRNAERIASVVEAVRALGGTAEAAMGDLCTVEGAACVSKAALEHWGGIDILINNAGGPSNATLTWETATAEDWARTYELNVVSAVRMIEACLPQMRARKWGRIIQVGSMAATAPGAGGIPDYSAAKAALNAMTVHLARTLAGSGITVNAVSPGIVVTPVLENYLRSQPGNADRDWQEIEEEAATAYSVRVGRLTKPEDLGPLVTFVASPLAAHIHGAILRADGGTLCSVS